MPAYHEATTPRNRALYERHGYVTQGEFTLPATARRCGGCGASPASSLNPRGRWTCWSSGLVG